MVVTIKCSMVSRAGYIITLFFLCFPYFEFSFLIVTEINVYRDKNMFFSDSLEFFFLNDRDSDLSRFSVL